MHSTPSEDIYLPSLCSTHTLFHWALYNDGIITYSIKTYHTVKISKFKLRSLGDIYSLKSVVPPSSLQLAFIESYRNNVLLQVHFHLQIQKRNTHERARELSLES